MWFIYAGTKFIFVMALVLVTAGASLRKASIASLQ